MRLFLISLTSLCLSFQAFGQDSTSTTGTTSTTDSSTTGESESGDGDANTATPDAKTDGTKQDGDKKEEAKPIDLNKTVEELTKRKTWYVNLNLIGVGIIAPSKSGFSLGGNIGQYLSIEGEYISGSLSSSFLGVEIQEFTETVLTISARIFPQGETFNIFLGWGRRDISIEILDLIGTTAIQSGWEIGVGQRWQLGLLMFQIDWASIWTPLGEPRYSDQKLLGTSLGDEQIDEAKDDLDKVASYPTVTLLKLGIGLQF